MDTVYYYLDRKTIKVSGGADLVTFVPQAAPARRGGEVLDFDRCRRKLETKAAWRELSRTTALAAGGEEDGAEAPPPVRGRRSHRGDWLELLASAATLLTALTASWAFLRLL